MKSKVNELSIALRTLFSEWLLMTWIAYSEDHYAIAISWLHILRNPCCYIFSRVVLWIAYSEDQRATVHVAIRWEQILHNPLFFGFLWCDVHFGGNLCNTVFVTFSFTCFYSDLRITSGLPTWLQMLGKTLLLVLWLGVCRANVVKCWYFPSDCIQLHINMHILMICRGKVILWNNLQLTRKNDQVRAKVNVK